MRPNNDNVTKVFDWLFLGGVKNTRKTLKHVDIWYDFKWDTSEPKNLIIPRNVVVKRLPFDDGDLEAAVAVWTQCFSEIKEYKKQGKKVLVSCYEGMSRSAVLALWLVCDELGDYEVAMNHLRASRNVYPDKAFVPFLNQLKVKYRLNKKSNMHAGYDK